MMRENWTEGGEDDEEGKRRCCRKRERKREKDERKVKRGIGTGQQGYEDGVGRGEEGEGARRRKGRGAVVSLQLRGRKEGRRVEKRVA